MINLSSINNYGVASSTPVILFALIIFLSTIMSILAIRKIFETAKELARSYNKVKINKKILILHSILLIFYCASVTLYVLDYFYIDYIRSGKYFVI